MAARNDTTTDATVDSARRREVELYCPSCDRSYDHDLDHCPDDGTRLVRLSPDAELALGRVIDGRFRILSKIAGGGMGVVYRAQQVSVGRDVALKVINARMGGDRGAAKRFLREAKLTSRLSHINTVTVLDFGQTEDGLLYLVMELLEGRTLSKFLGRAALPLERTLRIVRQLCDSLEAAHTLGIIHRDLKPSNIIVVDERPGREVIKVLDFGLAKSLTGEDTEVTRSDVVLGTPRYMSPDAMLNHPVDGRVDLYSLGVILYEMLAGRLPFDGIGAEALISQHATAEPRPLDDSVPALLRQIVHRLLRKHPDDRYQSAAELHAALSEAARDASSSELARAAPATAPRSDALAGLGEATTAYERPIKPRPRAPRSRAMWLALAAVFTLGAALLAYQATNRQRGAPQGARAGEVDEQASRTPSRGLGVLPASAKDAETATVADTGAELEPARIPLSFETSPSGAKVSIDGATVGTTPFHGLWPRGDRPLRVVIKRRNYKSIERRVVPDRPVELEFELTPAPKKRGHRIVKSKPKPKPPDAGPSAPDDGEWVK